MSRRIELTAVIEKEDNMYLSLCPELDIASQGETPDEAKSNLVEAIELFYETASETEITKRLHNLIGQGGVPNIIQTWIYKCETKRKPCYHAKTNGKFNNICSCSHA